MTVETEVNWDSMITNERGPSLADSLGLSCRYRSNFCSALAALVGAVLHCKKSKNYMPHENASWKRAGHK
jgi:hypothetical protein